MTQNIINSLNARYPQFADNSEPEDLMVELINDTRLLHWPSFRAQFATTDVDDYLDQASETFGTPAFVARWVPAMLTPARAY